MVEICQGLLKRILCEMNWHLLMLRLGLMRNTTKMKPTLLEPLPFTGLENLPIKKSILGWWFTFFIFRNQFGQWFNWAVKKQQERIGESLRVGTSTA